MKPTSDVGVAMLNSSLLFSESFDSRVVRAFTQTGVIYFSLSPSLSRLRVQEGNSTFLCSSRR